MVVKAGEYTPVALSYWKDKLTGAPIIIQLPTDHPRPAHLSEQTAAHLFDLSVTHPTDQTLLATFFTLLHRYTGEEDILVGIPDDANWLVIRGSVSGDMTFRQLHEQVSQNLIEADQNRDITFSELLRTLNVDLDASRHPLVQVAFDFTPPVDNHKSALDLQLNIWQEGKGLRAAFTYSVELFSADTIARMAVHYQNLLQGAVADQDEALIRLPLLTDAEREQLLVEWNATEVDFPQDVCVHRLFEEQVERTPEATALLFGGEKVTFDELNRRANQLAHYLQASGVGPETLVGICMERSVEMIVGMLGILKAGAAYVPMDPAYPADRLAFMVEDTQMPILLTQERLRDGLALETYPTRVFCLDTEWDSVRSHSDTNPQSDVQADNVVYVIYTSGSTGKPKGVLVHHRGLVNHNLAVADFYGLKPGEIAYQFSSISFDASAEEIFPTLITGSTLALRQSVQAPSVADFLHEVEFYGVTVLGMPTAYWHEWVHAIQETEMPPSVRVVVIGGERAAPEMLDRWQARYGHEVKLINGYGPTETTIVSTFYVIPQGRDWSGEIPIGRPTANTTTYILDSRMQPVPVGVPGELYIGGVGVTRGYLNRPELTAERFLADPFRPGARIYKTGDLCRFLPDGNIEYLGRTDFQVKVRGYRIELGEIEAALAHHPAIKQSVVVVREDEPNYKRIVAYNLVHTGQQPTAVELRNFLKESLPEYMIPSVFMTLETYPLTPSGKVNRRALPVPAQVGYEGDAEYVAPRTPTEITLAAIWKDVLKLSRVGVNEDFFELGGHSLLAARVVSQIRREWEVELPLSIVFEKRTIMGLASLLDSDRRDEGVVPVRRASRDKPIPQAFAQQRVWFLHEMDPAESANNIAQAFHFEGKLDVKALHQMLNELVRRHEALRTTMELRDGQPIQVIHAPRAIDLPFVDLRGQKVQVEALMKAEGAIPLDLAREFPIRAKLFQVEDEKYELVLTIHHAIFDGSSSNLLVEEMAILYAAFVQGKPSPLPEVEYQFADFAAWQQEWLNSPDYKRQLAYWQARLSDHTIAEMPTDHPRPPVMTSNGAYHRFSLPQEIADALKDLSQREGVTLYMAALAALQTLMVRFTGSEDIRVGTAIANRTRSEFEQMIGMFVNILVLRTDLSGSPTFREVLKRVREVALGAYAHQDMPFDRLVDVLRPKRDRSRTPLFQVLFVWEDHPVETLDFADVKMRTDVIDNGTAKFDLSLYLYDHDGRVDGFFEYNTDLFNPDTIERLTRYLQTLMKNAAERPDCRIEELSLLDEEAQHKVLVEWNATRRDDLRMECLHTLFEEQVVRTPARIAAAFGEEQITYDALNRAANRLAHALIDKGVGPDVVVAILAERSLEYLIAMLGILKAGGAFLPLNPRQPVERHVQILSQCQAPVVLGSPGYRRVLEEASEQMLPDTRPAVHLISELVKASDGETNPPLRCTLDHLAYMMFTSGSTGQPKGVMVEHRGMINHNYAKLADLEMTEADVLAQNGPQSFDIMVWQFLAPLLIGGRVHIFEDDIAYNPIRLLDEIEQVGITVLQIVPALLHIMIQEAEQRGAARPRLENLRWVVPTGEALPTEMCRQWLSLYPNIPLLNTYGSTECSDDQCHYPVREVPPPDYRLPIMTIGRPIFNMQIYVLDTWLQPVPVGVVGELYVGGIGVGRGYLNDPEKTAKAFLPDPFTTDRPGARLYKTGDQGRYLPDGTIEFLGRVDHMVKVRGYRIELGEIEAVLAQHPSVEQNVVIVREDTPGNPRLVAYVVPRGDVSDTNIWRSHLKEKLPEYMVPAAFMVMDALPLSANGKIDRKALPAPDLSQFVSDSTYVAPRNEIEARLASMWSALLGLDRVGIQENFFELGGHSLLVTRLLAQIRSQFGVELPLRSVFETPTIEGLSELLASADLQSQLPPVRRISRDEYLPQSFAQQRLFFLHQLVSDEFAYNIPNALHFRGRVRVDVLQATLNEIVRRHEALRTTFDMVDGRGIQVVHPHTPFTLPVIDLRRSPDPDQEAKHLAEEEATTPFDLMTGPLFRAKLLQLEDERFTLVFNAHHAVSDGVSTDNMVKELVTLYTAFAEGKPSPLPELDIQYADYAQWLHDLENSGAIDSQLAYWKTRLGDHTIAEMPTDNPRPPVQTFNGFSRPIEVPRSVAKALRALSQQEGVTLYMTLLAAFQTLMSRYTGSDDIRVGTAVASRPHTEFEPLVGMFVNTLVLRTDLSGRPTFREMIRRVREVALGAYAHQDVPFDRLVDVLRPDRDRSRTPLFQVFFVWEDDIPQAIEFAGLTMSEEPIENYTAKFDLSIYLREIDGKPSGVVEYNTDLFEHDTIARMISHFQRMLEGIAENPDQQIADIPLLTDEEAYQLLVEWNQTEAAYPETQGIHHLIEAQVKRTPDRIAAIFDDQQLTYHELNARANQLAHTLINHGIGPDMLVGLCVERSLDMLVGLLGILKSGAGYVPIDPTFPAERVAYMLEDANAKVLVTEQSLLDTLPQHQGEVICMDTDWPQISQERDTNPDAPFAPQNLAYTIYTSGSTGKPKGVQLEHRGVVNFLNSMRKEPGLTENDVLLAVTTISFDIAVLELYLPLMVGAKVVIVSRDIAIDGVGLMQKMDQHGVTLLQATPATFRLLLEAGWKGTPGLKALVGGEPLPRVLANRMVDRTAEVWNMYGPTETTVWSTVQKVERGEGFISIGRPIDNTQIYILDSRMQPVPIGVAGELFIGGDGVARGYLNRAELTAEKFIPNPFVEGGRMYRTGDLARYIADGTMQFFGRADHQIKLRGYRIELGEIETVLAQHPQVKQNVVIVREDSPGNPRLVAYIVADGNLPDAGEWRGYLREKLPDYMIPSAFVGLEALPLTPNGKIDRKALPAPDPGLFADERAFVAPRNQVEEKLAAIWGEVLGVQRISVQDNFFELGGHSLLAMRIFAGIENEFGKRLPLTTLFATPTIEGLAELLPRAENHRNTVGVPPVLAIQANGSLAPFFCVGGGVLNLKNLSRYVGNDLPFYVLQSESLDGYQAVHSPMSEIAAFFLDAVKEIQPRGPYYIGGAYGSGIVALEMARLLEEQGEEVALLALFNTRPDREGQARSLEKRIISRLSRITDLSDISWLHLKEALQDRMWKYAAKFCKRAGLPLPDFLRGDHYEELLVRRAGKNYRPQTPFGQKATLFYTFDWYARQFGKPKWGWSGALAGELETIEVPGIPCDMFLDPFVQVLAMHFRERILQSQMEHQRF
ncbi:MAG: amino acid adenylation domain-containing protein [Anaerolineae bacterium]|nr:amino acid adenylation domain-containing protein [Anaerolineae bacterium]